MPKLIDYPRTTYTGAWELAEVTDDTGGKCAIETAARKLNRKVSGSFKAIIGSAVKFGLLTSKRDLLTTTTLFKRIKHAYDKQEELLFHREAFLTPPLFTQLCRKFRSRELPVQMLDVMLIREFGVEEINAQGVAKAFVEGCRMVGLLDEHNMVADIDALASQRPPRRELASPQPTVNTFRSEHSPITSELLDGAEGTAFHADKPMTEMDSSSERAFQIDARATSRPAAIAPIPAAEGPDAIASLFGLMSNSVGISTEEAPPTATRPVAAQVEPINSSPQAPSSPASARLEPATTAPMPPNNAYQIQVSGPGVNTTLSITEEEDIAIAMALLEKIRRQLKA